MVMNVMHAEFDLDAYLARIGYAGPRAATLDALAEIHRRHPQAIPFENLNPLLRWPVRLDAASLQRKLVRDGRGGYCFEQNLLLRHALQALGFRTRGLAARVLWNMPEGAVTPRGHMLLLVELDEGRYVADVGFGGLALTGPLRLETAVEQRTPHEPFRLLASGDGFVMQAKVDDSWRALYRFDLQEQLLVDYEVTNWYLSNHPGSHFVTGLIAARPETDRRYALRNHELAVHHLHGETERRALTTVVELRAALEDLFHVTLPRSPEVDATLQGVLARAGQPAV
jgi:N-hydroxyarylamine O-acetyltransferase